MDKYQQISLLAQAADILYRLLPAADPEHAEALLTLADGIADLADKIEGL